MPEVADHNNLTSIALVILVALVSGLLLTRLKQPPALGYILAGIVLGPFGFGLVENRETIQQMAELGVLMLLFFIGMDLSVREFKMVWKVALATTTMQILVAVSVMIGVRQFFGWDFQLAILLGFAAALSSTAVAIKMLEDLGEVRSRAGRVSIGVLIAQDLAVVPMMLVIAAFGHTAQSPQELYFEIGTKVFFAVAFLGLLLYFLGQRQRVRLPFLRPILAHRDLMALISLVFCFGAAAITGLLGLSAAYGAFLAGLIIGNSNARRIMTRTSQPIQSVLMMVFFLSIGLLLDRDFIWNNLTLVLGLTFLAMAVKTIVNVLFLRLVKESWPNAFLSGIVLAQIGEFSFLLAILGYNVGVLGQADYLLLVSVTVFSLISGPIWVTAARRLHAPIMLGITSGRESLRIAYGPYLRKMRARMAYISPLGLVRREKAVHPGATPIALKEKDIMASAEEGEAPDGEVQPPLATKEESEDTKEAKEKAKKEPEEISEYASYTG